MFKLRIFFLIVLINSFNSLSAQNRVIRDGDDKIKLVYRNGRLAEISVTGAGKGKYIITWEKGRVSVADIRTRGQVIISRDEYTYIYDSQFRICEIIHECEYGNHYYSAYLGKRYSENDTVPYKCYYSCQEGIDPPEISADCDKELRWQKIIEYELRNRSGNYQKGTDIVDYNPPCRDADLKDTDSEYYEFIRQD